MEIELSLMENFHGCVLWLLAAGVAKRTSSICLARRAEEPKSTEPRAHSGLRNQRLPFGLKVPSRSKGRMRTTPVLADPSSDMLAPRKVVIHGRNPIS